MYRTGLPAHYHLREQYSGNAVEGTALPGHLQSSVHPAFGGHLCAGLLWYNFQGFDQIPAGKGGIGQIHYGSYLHRSGWVVDPIPDTLSN